MYVQTKIFTVKADYVQNIIEKWTNRQKQIDGILDVHILVDDKTYRDERQVIIAIIWESKEKCKAWRTHPDHVAAHKQAKEKPTWILKVTSSGYDLIK